MRHTQSIMAKELQRLSDIRGNRAVERALLIQKRANDKNGRVGAKPALKPVATQVR